MWRLASVSEHPITQTRSFLESQALCAVQRLCYRSPNLSFSFEKIFRVSGIIISRQESVTTPKAPRSGKCYPMALGVSPHHRIPLGGFELLKTSSSLSPTSHMTATSEGIIPLPYCISAQAFPCNISRSTPFSNALREWAQITGLRP